MADTPAVGGTTSDYQAAQAEAAENTQNAAGNPTSTDDTPTPAEEGDPTQPDGGNDAPDNNPTKDTTIAALETVAGADDTPDVNLFDELLSGDTSDPSQLTESDISPYDLAKALAAAYPESAEEIPQVPQDLPEEPVVQQDAEAVIEETKEAEQKSEEAAKKAQEQAQKKQSKQPYHDLAKATKNGDHNKARAIAYQKYLAASTEKEKELYKWIFKNAQKNATAERARSQTDGVTIKQEKNAGDRLKELFSKGRLSKTNQAVLNANTKQQPLTDKQKKDYALSAQETGADEGIEGDGILTPKARAKNAKQTDMSVKDAKKLVEQQKEMGKDKGIVMDGRDIGTVVFPEAELKIFMTASATTRAQRRYDELLQKGDAVTYEEVLKNVEERDYIDTHRDNSPPVLAEDAIEIDNSHLTREEQFEIVLGLVNEVIKTE